MDSSINLVVQDSDPDGVVSADVANWSAQVISLPIHALNRHRAALQGVGVYVLVGHKSDDPGQSVVYVGEAENICNRLTGRHDQLRKQEMRWERVVVFTSDELNKGRARWIESRLIEEARSAGRALVANGKNSNRPPVNPADKVFGENFIRVVLMVIPFLRVSAFDNSALRHTPSSERMAKETGTAIHPSAYQAAEATNMTWRQRYVFVLREADGAALTAREIAERCVQAFPAAIEEKRRESKQEAIRNGDGEKMIEQIAAQVAAHAPAYSEICEVPESHPKRWTLSL